MLFRLADFLIQSSFQGFALWSLFWFFASFRKKPIPLVVLFDHSAVWVIRWVGILFFVYWVVLDFQQGEIMIQRMFGRYWFAFWWCPVTYVLTSQLLWSQKMSKSRGWRLLFVLALFFILSIEKVILLLTFIHREYLPSTWGSVTTALAIGVTNSCLQLGVFVFLVGLGHLIRSYGNQWRRKM